MPRSPAPTGRWQRADASMSLLVDMLTGAVDQAYAEARGRDRPGAHGARRRVLVAALLVPVGVCAGTAVAQVRGRSSSTSDARRMLVADVQRQTAGSDALSRSATALRAQVSRARDQATGPGITLTIADPRTQVSADALLDALEELRDAGAEAVQLEGTGPRGGPVAVRVVAETALLDDRSGVSAGGTALRAPYRFVVLGDPGTLSAALAIPGGVLDTVHQQGGTTAVARLARLRVSALRPLEHPRYARPVPPGTG